MAIPEITVRFDAPTAHDTTEKIEDKSYKLFQSLNPWTRQLNAYADAIYPTVQSIAIATAGNYRDELIQLRNDTIQAKQQSQQIALGDGDNYFYGLITAMAQQDLLNLNLQIKLLKMEKENASSN